eukprot:4332672-Alexandrium_andersonii.AAC.1
MSASLVGSEMCIRDSCGALWQRCGVPTHIVRGLVDVWCRIERYVELGGEVSAEPIPSGGSIPQGGPCGHAWRGHGFAFPHSQNSGLRR